MSQESEATMTMSCALKHPFDHTDNHDDIVSSLPKGMQGDLSSLSIDGNKELRYCFHDTAQAASLVKVIELGATPRLQLRQLCSRDRDG